MQSLLVKVTESEKKEREQKIQIAIERESKRTHTIEQIGKKLGTDKLTGSDNWDHNNLGVMIHNIKWQIEINTQRMIGEHTENH